MSSVQGSETPTSLPAGTAGPGRPDTASSVVPAPGRCPITLYEATTKRDQRRSRCIHPTGHWGPHVFGEVRG